jgi:hypothetical protein
MKRQYYLLLSVKTPGGFVAYGQYDLLTSPEEADEFFEGLKGSKEVEEEHILHIDLMETVDGLPFKIRTIGCTLDELTCNCKKVSLEVFRLAHLKGVKYE